MNFAVNAERFFMSRLLIVFLVAYCLSGCFVAGTRNRIESEQELISYVNPQIAHAICWWKPCDPATLTQLAEERKLSDDAKYYVLAHPQFPLSTRARIITEEGVDDYFIGALIRHNKLTNADVDAYLDFIKKHKPISRCKPLYHLLLSNCLSKSQYIETWQYYKRYREVMPLWGYLLPNCIMIKHNILVCKDELLQIKENPALPIEIYKDIETQLNLLQNGTTTTLDK